MTQDELLERVLDELTALRGANLDLHTVVHNGLADVRVGMGKLEERVGSVISERLRKHSDNFRELSTAIGAVKSELTQRDDEIEQRVDELRQEASEKRGEKRVREWARDLILAAGSSVATALLIKALGG